MMALSPGAFTGDVVLQMLFDDGLDRFTARVSTDGGTPFHDFSGTHTASGWSDAAVMLKTDPRTVVAAAKIPAMGIPGLLSLALLLCVASMVAERVRHSRAHRYTE